MCLFSFWPWPDITSSYALPFVAFLLWSHEVQLLVPVGAASDIRKLSAPHLAELDQQMLRSSVPHFIQWLPQSGQIHSPQEGGLLGRPHLRLSGWVDIPVPLRSLIYDVAHIRFRLQHMTHCYSNVGHCWLVSCSRAPPSARWRLRGMLLLRNSFSEAPERAVITRNKFCFWSGCKNAPVWHLIHPHCVAAGS